MAEMTRSREVPVQLLRWTCNPELLGFDTTKECNKTDNIIGQNRAVKAITLGLEIESPGYNIYVSGMTGTGKTTTIKNLLSQLDLKKPIPDDICYVHNFKDPDMPRAIMFPAGSGRKLQKDMDDLVAHLRKEIPLILESDEFKKESEEVINTFRQKQKEIIREFNDRLLKENFQLVQFQMGPFTRQDIAPIVEGRPVPFEQLEAMAEEDKFSKEELATIRTKIVDLRIELDSVMRETRDIEREIRQQIGTLEHKYGSPAVIEQISDLRLRYVDSNEKVNGYLDEVQEHILSNLKIFQEKEEDSSSSSNRPCRSPCPRRP